MVFFKFTGIAKLQCFFSGILLAISILNKIKNPLHQFGPEVNTMYSTRKL